MGMRMPSFESKWKSLNGRNDNRRMEAIQEIQEIVDENKDQMPTGAVTAIMSKCQEAYKALPKLYKLQTVHIRLCHGELRDAKETLIVEQCSKAEWEELTYRTCTSFSHVMRHKKMPEEALKWSLPFVDSDAFGNKVLAKTVLVSITPYSERSREE